MPRGPIASGCSVFLWIIIGGPILFFAALMIVNDESVWMIFRIPAALFVVLVLAWAGVFKGLK